MTYDEILAWLKTTDEAALDTLWARADALRRTTVGNAVHLRGLIEMSNHCVRRCGYCGLHVGNRELTRYRMSDEEVLACAGKAVLFGYGTVVIQTGEDDGLSRERIAGIVRRIKHDTSLAVTLSLGERSDDLACWREAGADRYLLRFETSDPVLYDFIHPSLKDRPSDRFAILEQLRELGYEVGSGVMIGIPGQSYASLARDIMRFRELNLDMIGVGPYISHPDSDLASHRPPDVGAEQVPNTEAMVYKAVALTRRVCPEANIPSTTALATLNKAQGRELGLSRGANIVMPNLTPRKYRALYEIYPAKVCIDETAKDCLGCMHKRIRSIGREVGRGQGARANFAGVETVSAD